MQILPASYVTTAVEIPPATPSVTGATAFTKDPSSTGIAQPSSDGATHPAAVIRTGACDSVEPQAPTSPIATSHVFDVLNLMFVPLGA
jgi:hypothetical protein